MARLEVTFLVDADGLLRVTAREETTGKRDGDQVKPTYGLTDEEVERMLLDSFAHAEDDVKARQLAEQRVEAERILAAARAAMADSPELLTDDDRSAIDAAHGRRWSGARPGRDHSAIRAAIERLDAASKDFAGRRMNRALEAGLRGRAVGEVEAEVAETEPKSDLADPAERRRARGHSGHSHQMSTVTRHAQGEIRARWNRDRGPGRDVDPGGVEPGARPGGVGVRRASAPARPATST